MTNNTLFTETISVDITSQAEKTLREIVDEQMQETERKATDREKLLRLLDDRAIIDRLKYKLLQQGFVIKKVSPFGVDLSHEYMKPKGR